MTLPDDTILSPEFRQRLAEALGERQVKVPCPSCASEEFLLIDGYCLLPVMRPAAGSQDFTLDSHRALIAIECADCGLLRYHSLARLGLEPE